MATSNHFRHNVKSEQNLYEDLIIESMKFYGNDVYYIPREVVSKDTIFDDSILSRFEYAYKVEMYIENVEGFDGEGDLFSKFGVEIRDAATFVMARRRWNQEIGSKHGFDPNKDYRPREGDLIFLPLSQSIFQIMKVETENPFYQLSNLPVFKMRCELFEYSDEDFDTGINNIDNVEGFAAYQYVATMGDSASPPGYTIGEQVSQVFSDYTLTAEVVKWSDSDNMLYLAHLGADDGDYHNFTTTQVVVGAESGAQSTPTLVQELQNIQNHDVQEIDFSIDAFEFIDWSERNPFGDPQ